ALARNAPSRIPGQQRGASRASARAMPVGGQTADTCSATVAIARPSFAPPKYTVAVASTATTELTDSHRISGARISALACQRAHTVRADSVTNFGLDAEIHANRERPGTPVTQNRAGTVPADEDRRAVVSGVDAMVAAGHRHPLRAGPMAWVGEWRDCGEACPIVSLHMRQLACFPASP